jgi:hypothetical protein
MSQPAASKTDRVHVAAQVDRVMADRLKARAAREDRSVSAVLRRALDRELARAPEARS